MTKEVFALMVSAKLIINLAKGSDSRAQAAKNWQSQIDSGQNSYYIPQSMLLIVKLTALIIILDSNNFYCYS